MLSTTRYAARGIFPLTRSIMTIALSTPKSLLSPAGNTVRAISTSAEKNAEVPVAQRSGGGPTAPIPRAPRREVPLPSQEGTKGLVQYAL
ncbi:hypothetical protein EV426DRAFT_10721 [Tirmania nivea]|nr:hypothetical protein EV426DRAFT_10721 [Tirmania nivea]